MSRRFSDGRKATKPILVAPEVHRDTEALAELIKTTQHVSRVSLGDVVARGNAALRRELEASR